MILRQSRCNKRKASNGWRAQAIAQSYNSALCSYPLPWQASVRGSRSACTVARVDAEAQWTTNRQDLTAQLNSDLTDMQSAQQKLQKARLNLQNKLEALDAKKKTEEAQKAQKLEAQKLWEA